MFRITSQTKDGLKGGQWRVMDGDNHECKRGDNPNAFFATKRAAGAKCRDLNN